MLLGIHFISFHHKYVLSKQYVFSFIVPFVPDPFTDTGGNRPKRIKNINVRKVKNSPGDISRSNAPDRRRGRSVGNILGFREYFVRTICQINKYTT